MPFLLPLMFQIGFGMTPFESGMVTFVSALGAIGMKFVTAWIFRKAGFRRVLMFGSLLAGATIAVNGLFTPQTPYPLMLAMLLVGGFIRSMFFTGVNALAFADIADTDTSKATPITAVFQQICIALGVALAGGILEVSSSLHGGRAVARRFPCRLLHRGGRVGAGVAVLHAAVAGRGQRGIRPRGPGRISGASRSGDRSPAA